MINDEIQSVNTDYQAKILVELGQEALDDCHRQHQVLLNDNETGMNTAVAPREGYPYQAFYEATMRKMKALEKVMDEFIALQPIIRKALDEQNLAEEQPGIDIMLWTLGTTQDRWGFIMHHLVEPTHWWLADSKTRYLTFEQAQTGLQITAQNISLATIIYAARSNARDLVKMMLSKVNAKIFKKIMQAELGQWLHDPTQGVMYPANGKTRIPSAIAIECLLSQAPETLDKDPEGLIFHAMEQFRLRYISKHEIDESEAAQIIKVLLATPSQRTETTLNDLKYYKRCPGTLSRAYYNERYQEGYRFGVYSDYLTKEDPLPLECEYMLELPAADGITCSDVYIKGFNARRRVHNQYTLLMLSSIYHMKSIMQVLLQDPRIQLEVKTMLLTHKSMKHLTPCDWTNEWVQNSQQSNIWIYSEHDTPIDVLHLTKSMQHRLTGEYDWIRKHKEVNNLLREAYIKAFCIESHKAEPSKLGEIKKKYLSAEITSSDASKCLLEEAKQRADKEITNEKKIEVLCDAINHIPSNSALATFLGEKEGAGLQMNLFKEMQRYTTAPEGAHTSAVSIIKEEKKKDRHDEKEKKKERAENNKL